MGNPNLNDVQYDLVELEAGETTFLKPKDMEPGQVVKGILSNVRESEFKGKPTFTYFIEVGEGQTIGLNGCGHLDFWMRRGMKGRAIPEGSFVEITYQGKQELESGDEAHQFKVRASKGVVTSELSVPESAGTKKSALKSKVDKLKKEIND